MGYLGGPGGGQFTAGPSRLGSAASSAGALSDEAYILADGKRIERESSAMAAQLDQELGAYDRMMAEEGREFLAARDREIRATRRALLEEQQAYEAEYARQIRARDFWQPPSLDTIQGGLDTAGYFFDPADWINAGISYLRGHKGEALLSVAASVPIWGSIFKKAAKWSDELRAALDYAVDPNKMRHIFGKAEHGLGPLVKKLGSQENVMYEVVENLGNLGKNAGKFEVVRNIGGADVVIRGFMHEGVPKIGTMFVK